VKILARFLPFRVFLYLLFSLVGVVRDYLEDTFRVCTFGLFWDHPYWLDETGLRLLRVAEVYL